MVNYCCIGTLYKKIYLFLNYYNLIMFSDKDMETYVSSVL